ncbi:MAG TPA: hypothetical protein VEG64_10405 [Candidatus Sulfotelmatobacter sp.]|nr:hypothetical protein [Candidatus Sulfotelmatobacter sp.]
MTKKKNPRGGQPTFPDPERHARGCTICNHPERAEIEEMFLHWRSTENITDTFKVGERCIYRHAHATGLYHRRRKNLRFVLDTILQCADHVSINAMDIITAARTYAHINDDGEWVEPATTHRVIVDRAAEPGNQLLAPVEVKELPAINPEFSPANENDAA